MFSETKYRSSSNVSEIGQQKLGYLPLNFFNFAHFRVVANDNSDTYNPICFKLWNYDGLLEIPFNIEYERNQSTGTGLSSISPLLRCCNDNSNKYDPICFKLGKYKGPYEKQVTFE